MNRQFDICIIGAGVAGATIAAYLARRGVKIALIDRCFSEKNRIVGELLQPGAVSMLKKMQLQHLLDGIDGQKVFGYALFKDQDDITVPYNKNDEAQFHGMGMHNGRFLQKVRAEALQYDCVTSFEGKAMDLIEENQVITGVNWKDKKTGEIHQIKAKLTITSDGFFSNFRKDLSENKKTVTSFFIGLLLKDCDLPHAHHGHVFLSGPTPFICYPISNNEVRLLVDFAGNKAPKKDAIQEHLKNNVEPHIPECMKQQYRIAVNAMNFKVMPNHYMAAKPVMKTGGVLLGDALNMRHPITGGGITATFSDVYLLSQHLLSMPDFNNPNLIHQKVEKYYKERKVANANVNILANALYGVMSHELLKEAVFKYLSRGGDSAQVPITILAGLNRDHKTLVKHFFLVAFFGVARQLKQNFRNLPNAVKVIVDALKIIKPLAKNELSFSSLFSPSPHYDK